MPHFIERRAAPRVPCSLPLRLVSQGRVLRAQVRDLSRHGVGVRVALSELGLGPTPGPEALARALEALLAETLAAEFCYDQIGPLVRRALRPVRIARVDGGAGAVELGCALRSPLSDAEVEILGVEVPPAVAEPAEAAGPRLANAAGPWTAYLSAAAGREAPPLCSRRAGADPGSGAFRLEFPDARRLPLDRHGHAPGQLMLGLVEAYGEEPGLLVLGAGVPLWGGTARLEGLEVRGEAPPEVLLSLRPGRPLTEAERLRLGLAAG